MSSGICWSRIWLCVNLLGQLHPGPSLCKAVCRVKWLGVGGRASGLGGWEVSGLGEVGAHLYFARFHTEPGWDPLYTGFLCVACIAHISNCTLYILWGQVRLAGPQPCLLGTVQYINSKGFVSSSHSFYPNKIYRIFYSLMEESLFLFTPFLENMVFWVPEIKNDCLWE